MRSFTPPTPDQVRAHLNRFAPQPPSRLASWSTVIALPLLLLIALANNNSALIVLPMIALGAILATTHWRLRRQREQEEQTLRVQELAMQRRFIESLRLAWQLLPRVVQQPQLHGRVVATIAHDLDELRCYDAAIVAYDYLLERMAAEDPAAVQFQVLRSLAQLATDRLTDADDTLRRLRGVIGRFRDTAIGAAYRLALLVQQIRTNHYQQAIDESDSLLDALRPLGVQAGYGHALMALAYRELARHHNQPTPAAAREWWHRATLLLSPEALMSRFPELRVMNESAAADTSHIQSTTASSDQQE